MIFRDFAEALVLVVQSAGMAVIILGLIFSSVRAGWHLLRGRDLDDAYRRIRLGFGHSLILGIDLLIASEVILSILAEDLETITVLGATVIVRMFLSFAIAIDVEGRVPWRRNSRE